MVQQKGIKMIDYENVLKDFIGEVIVYLTRLSRKVDAKIVFERIIAEIEKLKVIKSNPVYYADYNVRVKNNLVVEPMAFVVEDGTFLLFTKVMWAAQDINKVFDYEREKAQKVLMGGYKTMKIKNAKNVFEKLKLKLQNPEKIAQNVKQR